jgi:hypothetical protein
MDSCLRFPLFVLEEIFPAKLNVAQYLGKQAGTNILARVHWNDRRPAIRMFQKEMTTPLPVNDKPEVQQHRDYLFPL